MMCLVHNHTIERRTEGLLNDDITKIIVKMKDSGIPPNQIHLTMG